MDPIIENGLRLDASESLFFERELEAIDARMYEIRYSSHRAREHVPTQGGIPDWARTYTWREMDQYGEAKILAHDADDLPSVGVSAAEYSKTIKLIGASYQYGVMEIKAAAALGKGLDDSLARAARRAVSSRMDKVLAYGDSALNLEGLLTLASAQSFTVSTKAAGGTTWGTTAAPNATADEMLNDLFGIVNARQEATDGEFDDFDILLPLSAYNVAARTKVGVDNTQSVLKYFLETCEFCSSVKPWYRCNDGDGDGSNTKRMVCYPKDPEVVAGIVPMEYTSLAPQLTGLVWKVPTFASSGGVVCRYPIAVAYGDNV